MIVSAEGVRSFGPFSSKDRAIINKDKTLVFTLRPNRRLMIELFGKDDAPELDWISKDEGARDYANLYRDIAIGGERTICKVLSAFGVPNAEIEKAIASESFNGEYAIVSLEKKKTELGDTYSVKFLKTV